MPFGRDTSGAALIHVHFALRSESDLLYVHYDYRWCTIGLDENDVFCDFSVMYFMCFIGIFGISLRALLLLLLL